MNKAIEDWVIDDDGNLIRYVPGEEYGETDDEESEWHRVCIRKSTLALFAPEMALLLLKLEHVKLPGMPFSRCPICGSPLDLSQPHEDRCELDALMKRIGAC